MPNGHRNWVLTGAAGNPQPTDLLSCHASLQSGDDLLRKFWEVEEPPPEGPGTILSTEDSAVMEHFQAKHYRKRDGRLVVPLPKRAGVKEMGESRSQAVRRFLSMERTLHSSSSFRSSQP